MSHLKTMLKRAAFGAVLTIMAAPAMAAVHTVYIYRDGYFPSTLYASPNDKVLFVNKSGAWAYVSVLNGSSITNWISNGSSQEVPVTGSSMLTLNKPTLWNVSNSNGNRGYVRFSPAPRQ